MEDVQTGDPVISKAARQKNESGQATRGTFIVVLLVSTLVLAGALTYQALDSVASHRATAKSVVDDYAAFAAEQYAARVSRQVEYYGIRPTLQQLAYRYVGTGVVEVPTIERLQENANRALNQSLDLARYLFRFNTRTGEVVHAADEAESPPEWLGEALAAHAQEHADTTANVALAVLTRGDGVRVFPYLIYPNDEAEGQTAFAFEADLEVLAGYFRSGFEGAPLLPPTLTGGVSYDSLLSARITTAAGGAEFLNLTGQPQPDGPYRGSLASRPLPATSGALNVEIRLDPAAAEMLVIGGLPSSRLPFILGLFLLTAGLIAAALLQLRREQELDRLRTQFVSNVSHELRTPLAQIRMFAETLLLGRVRSDEERQRSLAIMDREARRLAHLVENVLLFSRSERSSVKLERQRTELQPLFGQMVESFRPLAEAQGNSLTVTAEPIAIHVDPGAVQQIVLNLLDNAVKYGPNGQHVTVTALLREGWARIAVEDQGPGVPEGDRTRVWERFGRLERERKSAVAGAGIGLAVVAELTRLHEGRCFVEEGDGGGARFVIELPGARLAEPQGSEPAPLHPEDAVAKTAP